MAIRQIIRSVATTALGLTFLVASIMKLRDPVAFADTVHRFQLTPRPLSIAIAYFLPWLEIWVALALVSRRWRAAGLHLIAAMSLGFAFVLASAWSRGLNVNCGCFGNSSGAPDYPWLLARALVLAITAIALLVPAKDGPPG